MVSGAKSSAHDAIRVSVGRDGEQGGKTRAWCWGNE